MNISIFWHSINIGLLLFLFWSVVQSPSSYHDSSTQLELKHIDGTYQTEDQSFDIHAPSATCSPQSHITLDGPVLISNEDKSFYAQQLRFDRQNDELTLHAPKLFEETAPFDEVVLNASAGNITFEHLTWEMDPPIHPSALMNLRAKRLIGPTHTLKSLESLRETSLQDHLHPSSVSKDSVENVVIDMEQDMNVGLDMGIEKSSSSTKQMWRLESKTSIWSHSRLYARMFFFDVVLHHPNGDRLTSTMARLKWNPMRLHLEKGQYITPSQVSPLQNLRSQENSSQTTTSQNKTSDVIQDFDVALVQLEQGHVTIDRKPIWR